MNGRITTLMMIVLAAGAAHAADVRPPKPLLPVPSAPLLAWQQDEIWMFQCFNMPSYPFAEELIFTFLKPVPKSGERGARGFKATGREDPNLFNPTELDCDQWVKVAAAAGFKGIVLTTKHHDGFCIWPTATTTHSVKSSSWRGGKGDVVADFVKACRKGGLKVGLYYSIVDFNYLHSGRTKEDFPKYYQDQLTELLTNYGPIDEFWLDGCHAEMVNAPGGYGDDLMERLQPDMVIVGPADGGKKMMRNRGIACKESSAANPDLSNVRGQKRDTSYWFPAEACTIMTGGWFWQGPNTRRESLKTTLDIYYNTVGRGANLLLNVAADRRGKIDDASVKQLQEWRAALDQTFKVNLAAGMTATASNIRGGDKAFGPSQALDGNRETYWCTDDGVTNATMEVDLGGPCEFDVVLVQEYIALGQRVEKWRVESLSDATWTTVAGGATIGQMRLERIKPVTATKVRLVIEKSAACPTIHAFGLYKQAKPPVR